MSARRRAEFHPAHDAGLLRRMDYQPVVNGRTPVAYYIRSEDTFDGIVVPDEPSTHRLRMPLTWSHP